MVLTSLVVESQFHFLHFASLAIHEELDLAHPDWAKEWRPANDPIFADPQNGHFVLQQWWRFPLYGSDFWRFISRNNIATRSFSAALFACDLDFDRDIAFAAH